MKTDKIASSYQTYLGETQFTIDVALHGENDKTISQVLSTNGEAFIDEVELLNGEANYSGELLVNVLYVDDGGENNVLSERVDLNGKYVNEQITPFMKPIFDVEIVDIKVGNVTDDVVSVAVTLNLKLDAIKTDEVNEVNVDEMQVETQKENVEVTNLVTSGSKDFYLEEEFDVKQDVKKVLLTTHHLELKNVTAGTGYFVVDGELVIHSLLEVETEDGLTLKNFMQTMPFKEEIEDEKIEKEDDVLAFLSARPQDIRVVVIDAEVESENATPKNTMLKVEAKVLVRYIAERTSELEVITDAFSMTNQANIISETFVTGKPTKVERFTATIEGQTIIDGEPRISKICAVTNEHLLIANSGIFDGKLTIEGVAYANVIYQTDDDVLTLNSVDLEIPFSNKFDASDGFGENVFVTGTIVDIDAKAKKGKEVNVSLDVCFLVLGYQTETQVVIKDIELGEEVPKSEYSLEMFIAPKGSTIWDISRHLLVSEKVLREQNPELTFPLDSSKTIVYYRENG